MKGTFEIYSPLHTSQLSSVIGPCEWQLKAIYNFKPTPFVPKSYSPQDLASFLLVSYLEYTCHCCFTALHMDTKDKPVGRSSTINPKVKVGVAPSMVAEKVKVGITPSMVSEKVKDGKVSLETDTLQAGYTIVHPIEHTEVVVPHVDRPYDPVKNVTKKRET